MYAGVLLFAIAIIAKIIVVQTRDRKDLMEKAKKRELFIIPLEASRGNILSCDDKLLATSVPVFDIFFDARVVQIDTFSKYIDSLSFQIAEAFPQKTAKQLRLAKAK